MPKRVTDEEIRIALEARNHAGEVSDLLRVPMSRVTHVQRLHALKAPPVGKPLTPAPVKPTPNRAERRKLMRLV